MSADQRTDDGGRVAGVSDRKLGDRLGESSGELLRDGFGHIDPLNRNAGLPTEGVAPGHRRLDSAIQVRIGGDDHGGVRTQLQHMPLAPGIGLQSPADLGRAGERHHGHIRVGVPSRHDLSGTTGDHIQPAGRQSDLGQRLGQQTSRQWCPLRRLEHHGAAGGQSRCDLVQHQVEREVERSDGGDDPAVIGLPASARSSSANSSERSATRRLAASSRSARSAADQPAAMARLATSTAWAACA